MKVLTIEPMCPYLEVFNQFLYLPVFRWKISICLTPPLYRLFLLLALCGALAEGVFSIDWGLCLHPVNESKER